MLKKLVPFLVIFGIVILMTAGCAPGNERWDVADPASKPANFWAGLWHGLIIVVTFVVSWFTNDVGIYEPNNVGFGYNIGFILGIMMSLGGGVRGATHRKRKVKVVAPSADKIARRVERGVREGIKAAFSDREESMDEATWQDLGRKIEDRVKDAMKDMDEEC
jgi:hypothetical protein